MLKGMTFVNDEVCTRPHWEAPTAVRVSLGACMYPHGYIYPVHYNSSMIPLAIETNAMGSIPLTAEPSILIFTNISNDQITKLFEGAHKS